MAVTNDNINVSKPAEHFLWQVDAKKDKSVESLKQWIITNKDFLLEKMAKDGGIYFKGFNIHSAEAFEEIAKLIDPNLCEKHLFNGDARTWVTNYTYEVASPAIKKSLTPRAFHNEDSFVSRVPSTIMFHSLEPAAWGGQTLLADCRKVFDSLPDKLKKKYMNEKVQSKLILHDDVFLVNSGVAKNDQAIIDAAKAYGAKEVKRMSPHITQFSFEMPLVIYDSTNKPIWFNLLHLSLRFSYQLYVDTWFAYRYMRGFLNRLKAIGLIALSFFADLKFYLTTVIKKQKIDEYILLKNKKISILDRIRINLAFWKNAAVFPLQKGDLVVLDNRLIAHARMPYKGRRVLLSCMGTLVSVEELS